jgi:hypothetical protein
MHTTEDKTDDMKGSFYQELECVLDKFPKYHMIILLADFNAKVTREDIFNPAIGNENLHETSNDNGVRVVNFATSKNLTVKILPPQFISAVLGWLTLCGHVVARQLLPLLFFLPFQLVVN